jgi:hypothetical protein
VVYPPSALIAAFTALAKAPKALACLRFVNKEESKLRVDISVWILEKKIS